MFGSYQQQNGTLQVPICFITYITKIQLNICVFFAVNTMPGSVNVAAIVDALNNVLPVSRILSECNCKCALHLFPSLFSQGYKITKAINLFPCIFL